MASRAPSTRTRGSNPQPDHQLRGGQAQSADIDHSFSPPRIRRSDVGRGEARRWKHPIREALGAGSWQLGRWMGVEVG